MASMISVLVTPLNHQFSGCTTMIGPDSHCLRQPVATTCISKAAIENFLFDVLEESVGLFVANAFRIAFRAKTLTNQYLFFGDSHDVCSFLESSFY